MTENQAKRLADKAQPCPFCGRNLVVKGDHHGYWLGHDRDGQCFGGELQVLDSQDLGEWNTRDGNNKLGPVVRMW